MNQYRERYQELIFRVEAMPEEQRDRVKTSADLIRSIVNANGADGVMALSLVSLKLAAEHEDSKK